MFCIVIRQKFKTSILRFGNGKKLLCTLCGSLPSNEVQCFASLLSMVLTFVLRIWKLEDAALRFTSSNVLWDIWSESFRDFNREMIRTTLVHTKILKICCIHTKKGTHFSMDAQYFLIVTGPAF